MPSGNLTARMYFEQGRQGFSRREFDEASDNFRKAVDADPMFREAHQYLAETYEKLGYRHRARKAWEGLLRLTHDAGQQEEIHRRINSL
jgi:Tfp pilus assembly protein PilF